MNSESCQLFQDIETRVDDPILQKLRMNALKNCKPLFVSLELTQNCNFRCRHCYNFDRIENVRPSDKSLSLEQWKTVLSEIKAEGGMFLSLTGGEILLYPHLEQVIIHAKELGFSVRLKSNASLITKLMAIKLKTLGVELVEVSFYGFNDTVHNHFTGTQKQQSQVAQGILEAKGAGLDVMVNIILHKGNIHQFGAMKSWLLENQLVYQVSFDMTARHDGTQSSVDERVTTEQLEELFTSPAGRELLPTHNSSGNIQCGCARLNCGIGHDGKVYPCIGAPILSGDIREKSFGEIWNHSPVFKRIRGLTPQSFKTCFTCTEREYCQRSSGLTYLNTGDYTGAEIKTCQTAQLIKRLNQSS